MQSPTGGMGDGYGGAGGGMGEVPQEEQPWYVKYGLRALGTAAGGLAMFFGLFSLLFSVFSPTCIVFSVWQILCGFVVVTIESPCCCVFVEHVNKITEIVERKPLWIKAAVYVIAPIPSIIFCFGANTFLGSGAIIGTGIVYGMVSLGKKATREEMARNAQTVFPAAMGKNPYEPQVNSATSPPPQQYQQSSSAGGGPPYSSKPVTSPLTGYVDPIQSSAAQWAAQSATATFEPPPSYHQASQHQQATSPQRPVGWDQSFVQGEAPAVHNSQQQPRDPFSNPFQ